MSYAPRPPPTAFELTDRTLANVVRGRSRSTDPGEALHELLRRRVASTALLSEVVVDAGRPAEMRASAALALGRERRPAAAQALVQTLRAAEPAVVRRAAEALGKIGDRAALAQLERTAPPPGPARRSVDFAKSLISCRLGLNAHRLSRLPREAQIAVDARTAERLVPVAVAAAVKAEILAAARQELPGVPLSDGVALAFDCGQHRYALMISEQVRNLQDLGRLTRSSAVFGAVLERSATDKTYFLAEYLLANPGPEGRTVELFGVRPGGTMVQAGELDPASGAFRVRAVGNRVMPPVDIRGTYDARGGSLQIGQMLALAEFDAAQIGRTAEPSPA